MPLMVGKQARKLGIATALGLSQIFFAHAAGGQEELSYPASSEVAQQAEDEAQQQASIQALVQDLTDHPMAGGVVNIRLCAEDALGGKDCDMVTAELPLPQLNNPLGYEVQALRRELAMMVESAERGEDGMPLDSALKEGGMEVSASFDKFMDNYSTEFPNPETLLTVMDLQYNLQQKATQADLSGLENIIGELRQVTLQLEKDIMTPAQRALQEAKEALQEAMERGASDEELRELNEQMFEALENYMEEQKNNKELSPSEQQAFKNMQEFMKRLKEMLEEMGITPEEFAQMMQDMAQGASPGSPPQSSAEQKDMNLEEMLENLRKQIEFMQKMRKYIDDLKEITKEQQEIRDQTLSESLRQQERLPPESGAPDVEKLESLQENLRRRFGDLLDDMKDDDLSFRNLDRALREMGEAETDLENEREGQAVEDQDQALEALRQAQEGMQKMMMMMMPGSGGMSGSGPGSGNPQDLRGNDTVIDKDGRLRGSDNNNEDLGVSTHDKDKPSRDIRDKILERRQRGGEGSDYLDRLLEGPNGP